MQLTPFSDTGLFVSPLCMGTMTFGREADAEESAAMYAACREAGVQFFDCADVYAGGGSETILGGLIADERDDVVITSKVCQATGPSANDRGYGRRYVRRQIEKSLHRLGTEYLDVYFLHHFDPRVPLDDALRTLDDLVSEGKVLHIGVSNFAAWQVEKALGAAALHGYTKPRVIQPMYNLLKRQAEVELLPMARAEGLAVTPYSPLGAGVLTGKYRDKRWDAAAGRLQSDENYQSRYRFDELYDIATRFTQLAGEAGVDPATLAVAWVMKHPAVTAPILGARNVQQLKPALAAGSFELDDELYEKVTALSKQPPLATDRAEEQLGLHT